LRRQESAKLRDGVFWLSAYMWDRQ